MKTSEWSATSPFPSGGGNTENKIRVEDCSVHDWYRFVLSFPPHLVRQYLVEFGADNSSLVLDPFCGTGTTNVECKKAGIPSWGIEASPVTYFASRTKCTWKKDTSKLLETAERIAEDAAKKIACSPALKTLSEEQNALLLKNSICPRPLSDALFLKEEIDGCETPFRDYFLLALAKHLVYSYSNLKFGPEVGVGRVKRESADIVGIWFHEMETVRRDLETFSAFSGTRADIFRGDAREIEGDAFRGKVDFVITSPPYPNEKDYSRTTRLESVVLGFLKTKDDLRAVKQGFIRSNTKNIYRSDTDDSYIQGISSIKTLSDEIERRRKELGKTSGFERLYSTVVKQYFGGMARHLSNLRPYLKEGAMLAYVVGDQASYFQIPIRTSSLLGEVAESLGYRVERVETFRKRFATATEDWLNEDVLILKYEGKNHEYLR